VAVDGVEKPVASRGICEKIVVGKSWLQTLDKRFIKTEFLHKNKPIAKSLCVKAGILPPALHRPTTVCKHIVHKASIAEESTLWI